MSTTTTPQADGAASPDRYDARRDELAESALQTLGERGYARTSLRDIAANSAFSHGVVHYYFRDKTELILHGVQSYKARCVSRYDDVVASAADADQLVATFGDKLVETMTTEAPMHRLWYDLRAQSMFEQRLRESVAAIDASLEQMIWRVVSRYAELSGRPVAVSPALAYAMLDGLFEQALLRHLRQEPEAQTWLTQQAGSALPLLLGPVG